MARRRNYGRGYSRYRRSGFRRYKWPILIVVIVIVAFLLISIAPAFFKLITGQLNEPEVTSQIISAVSSDTTDTEKETIPAEPMSAIALPIEQMDDLEQVQAFAQTAKEDGYTAVTVTLKDENGMLLYASKNKTANAIGAVSENALDLESLVTAITDADLTPVATMHTFKDPIAARDYEYCYLYKDGESMWLDNSLENGGKPWLSVYSSKAKKYLYQLEKEILSAGFEQLILESVQYPDVLDSSTIYFPEAEEPESSDADADTLSSEATDSDETVSDAVSSDAVSSDAVSSDAASSDAASSDETTDLPEDPEAAARRAALADFVAEMQTRAEAYDARVSVALDPSAAIGEKENIYFGDVYTVGFTRVSPVIDTADYPDSIQIGEKKIKNPAEKPLRLLEAMQLAAGEDCTLVPILKVEDTALETWLEALDTLGMTEYLVTSVE